MLKINKSALKHASLQADVDGESISNQLKQTDSLIKSAGGNIDEINLSRTSLCRYRKKARHGKTDEIKENESALLKDEKSTWVLHWDGKTFKKKTHCGNKKPVLAVLLKCLDNGKKIFG